MSTTAQEALDLAIHRSSLNNPDILPSAQMVRYIANAEKAAYMFAAKMNPEYFGSQGDSSVRAAYTDSWAINTTPGGIASVTKLEISAITGTVGTLVVGDKINLISYRWPQLELSPRAYIRGRILYAYNDELGDADINMITTIAVFYAQLPTGPTALATSLSIPDEWIDLIVLPLARNLALRDQRPEEVPSIDEEYKIVFSMFQQAVGMFEGGAVRPLASVPVATPLGAAGK
ncbi:hypothetical protein LCGC14_1247970 [marine sediment metagenome]|uniref:Uncharacterized protein n=1 Tax=marine sediment metagenome TaxID=412755 RepID=A0A0F9LQW7_9ZZZZ